MNAMSFEQRNSVTYHPNILNIAANNLEVDALFVYTTTGHMASLLSRCRPDVPIFAFTPTSSVRRRLNLQWGLIPFRLSFSDDMESNLNRTFSLLKARGMIKSGDLVIAVSDLLQSIQVMNIPWKRYMYCVILGCVCHGSRIWYLVARFLLRPMHSLVKIGRDCPAWETDFSGPVIASLSGYFFSLY